MTGSGGELRPIVAVVGATATGKTELAEALAEALDGEVVCADSRQVFRELEIGTGKPDPVARRARPHHLFDVRALEEPTSAGWYADACRTTCDAIHGRGRVPVLVGGSGLYLRAAQRGLARAPAIPNAVRARVRASLAADGAEPLHRRLADVDPDTAARLSPRDGQRIARALEVWEASGRTLAWWHAHAAARPAHAAWRVIGLELPPAVLAARIAARTRQMFAAGLIEETAALLAADRGQALAALRAIGYDEAMAHLAGRLAWAEAVERTSARTRQLAKRQRTWFRHQIDARAVDAGRSAAERLAESLRVARGRP